MQMAVSDSFETGVALDEPRGFLADIASRHARSRRQLMQQDADAGGKLDREVLLKLLNDALASEIACMLRYRRHFYLVRGTADEALMGELLDRANEEQRHADLIAERIVQLGGEPDLRPLGSCDRRTDYAEGTGTAEMVREELAAERLAIEFYAETLRFIGTGDMVTRRLIADILAEEKEHAAELASRLEALTQQVAPHGQKP